jgi:hypothetical protein
VKLLALPLTILAVALAPGAARASARHCRAPALGPLSLSIVNLKASHTSCATARRVAAAADPHFPKIRFHRTVTVAGRRWTCRHRFHETDADPYMAQTCVSHGSAVSARLYT